MLRWLWLSAALLVIDQATKWVALAELALHERNPVIPGFFNLTLVYNYGAAFSFLADHGGWQRWFFTALAVVASIALTVWLSRMKPYERWSAIGVAMIIGGAVGNLIDRVRFGYVVDFLDFFIGTYHWPAFNVADSVIVVGAAVLLIDGFRSPNRVQV